eukprot:1096327-Amphidinium_carterae.1
MLQDAIDILTGSVDKLSGADGINIEGAARLIKVCKETDSLDKQYGAQWHCVIGQGFSMDVTAQTGVCVLGTTSLLFTSQPFHWSGTALRFSYHTHMQHTESDTLRASAGMDPRLSRQSCERFASDGHATIGLWAEFANPCGTIPEKALCCEWSLSVATLPPQICHFAQTGVTYPALVVLVATSARRYFEQQLAAECWMTTRRLALASCLAPRLSTMMCACVDLGSLWCGRPSSSSPAVRSGRAVQRAQKQQCGKGMQRPLSTALAPRVWVALWNTEVLSWYCLDRLRMVLLRLCLGVVRLSVCSQQPLKAKPHFVNISKPGTVSGSSSLRSFPAC